MKLRLAVVVAVFSLIAVDLLGTAGPAGANRPISYFENNVHFVCDLPGVTTSEGTIIVSAADSTEFGRDASVLWWVPPETPASSPDSTFRSSSLIEDQTVVRNGYHFDVDVKMEDRDFNPVGNAIMSIDLIPSGVVEYASPTKSSFGNRRTKDNSFVKFFSVSGTVTFHVIGHDPTVFNVTDCTGPDGNPPDRAGFDSTIDVTTTDPSQFVLNKSGVLFLCDVETETYVLNVAASAEKTNTGGELQFFTSDSAMGGSTDSGLTLTNSEFSGTISLNDFDTGDPVGTAIIDVTFTQGEHTVVRRTDGSVRDRMIGYLLEPAGTITIPTSPPTVVDVSSCFAFDGREQLKEHRPRE